MSFSYAEKRVGKVADLVTCKYCGIVERGHDCPHRTKRKPKENTQIRRFRNSKAWINKSVEIRQKARYLCEVCMDNKYHTVNQFTYNGLEVHHIEPLSKAYDKRLDNDNLICLCQYHHKLAEKGEIPVDYLRELAEKREK